MTTLDTLRDFAREMLRPPSDELPSDWCSRHIYLPPPQTQAEGWLRWQGREYMLDFVNDFANPRITDCVACFGSQTAKTTALMAGIAWTIVNDPCSLLWVMPNIELARSFSETRWIPLINHSPDLARLKPSGAGRHKFKTIQQQIGASILNFIGSNSPANLASRPARRIIMDEVDKFQDGGRGEADAVNLAEQRTKSFANPQRFKTSTPTMLGSLIWNEFLKGDQCRYFVPCCHCRKHVVLAWSKAYTVMPLTGVEAFITWDKAAKRADGWDLDRVAKSARAICPHCGADILDGQKTKMVREGEWRPTATAPAHFRSRHLSSLYASGPQTSFGALAVKFLQEKKSFLGLQGFINGDLAEPYASQDTAQERIELVTRKRISADDWPRLMTVDYQQNAPHFWYVVRAWKDGDSEAIAAGYTDTWVNLEGIAAQHKVDPEAVMVDSGYDTECVYLECANRCRFSPGHDSDGRPIDHAIGWIPAKGLPTAPNWKDKESVQSRLKDDTMVDPFEKTDQRGKVQMMLLQFDSSFFKDVLVRLRAGKGGYKWTVSADAASPEYWRHLDAEVKRELTNKKTGRSKLEWVLRSERWPNHLLDCEVMQIALSSWFGLFKLT